MFTTVDAMYVYLADDDEDEGKLISNGPALLPA